MKLVQLADIANQAFTATGIGEKNTVSNGPDQGANNCQASHWWNVRRHGNTTQAIDNLLVAAILKIAPDVPEIYTAAGILSTGAANIVGHANEGQLETGMGQTGPFSNDQIILPWNEWNWGPQFDRINPTGITYVSLWGCNPGAGEQGADLLYAVAKRCGRAVRAPTGTLFCNSQSIWLENGSQWQVATPTNRPNPIPAPSPHFMGADMKFEVGGAELDLNDVQAIHLEKASITAKTAVLSAYRGAAAKSVVQSLFKSPAIDLSKVAIPAFITARATLEFVGGVTATFEILNDRIAVDTKTRFGYYVGSVQSIIDAG